MNESKTDSVHRRFRYVVRADDGWVSLSQENRTLGKDVLGAVSPEDARWMARCLLEAATEAERHERWASTVERFPGA